MRGKKKKKAMFSVARQASDTTKATFKARFTLAKAENTVKWTLLEANSL